MRSRIPRQVSQINGEYVAYNLMLFIATPNLEGTDLPSVPDSVPVKALPKKKAAPKKPAATKPGPKPKAAK